MKKIIKHKKKLILIYFCVIVVVFPFLYNYLFKESDYNKKCNGFLWEAYYKGSRVYLFGVIHFGLKEMLLFNPKVEQSFAEADIILAETIQNKKVLQEAEEYVIENGFYKNGSTVRSILSHQDILILESFLREHNCDVETYLCFKPSLLASELYSLKMAERQYSIEYGIDTYFLQKAKKIGKQILPLEDRISQVKLLIDHPEALVTLRNIIHDLKGEAFHQYHEEITNSWKDGDLESFKSLVLANFSINEREDSLYNKFYFSRNMKMSKKIIEMLNKETNNRIFFVIIGGGHLVGKGNLIEMLQESGLELKRIAL